MTLSVNDEGFSHFAADDRRKGLDGAGRARRDAGCGQALAG